MNQSRRVWKLFPDCPGTPGQLLAFIFTRASPGCCLHSSSVRPGPGSCCSHPSCAPAAPSLWIEGEGGAGAPLESRAVLGVTRLPQGHRGCPGCRAGGKRGSLQQPRSCVRQSLDAALSHWGGEHQQLENIPVEGRGVAVPSILLSGCGRQPGRRCRVLLTPGE